MENPAGSAVRYLWNGRHGNRRQLRLVQFLQPRHMAAAAHPLHLVVHDDEQDYAEGIDM
jgi:hypothetical protein